MEEVKRAIQNLLTATHNDAMNDGRSEKWRKAKDEAMKALLDLYRPVHEQPEIDELISRHNHIVAQIEEHGMIESHRSRITGALNSMAQQFESFLLAQEAQLDYYKDDLDKIRAMVDAKEDQSTVEAVKEMTRRNGKSLTPEQIEDVEKNVHTEHCCYRHGCKYGHDDCCVETGEKKQSHPCEQCCEEAADPVRSALQSFVDDFEGDFMIDDRIVDDPDGRWGRLTSLYKEARAALDE